ncbi:aminoglycoside phosphotransferase [Mycolicibacterium agri]|uniref:Aminoglycoside phosphotransferase n=1 Tax=Mycolicibacterium agri TaxID=36811 RepID=A0A2A7N3T0_MYCAG|nr:phosphotransferase [Mycolicibacterium agri]PEG38407.1 aminoglycoside phosphotransferase [Mycolicibacterium agri]GFG53853.1 aminoglycoside phosphotransferase [Mycolicibacterium agri]
MQTRSGAEIVVDGDVVYKLHRPGTDPRALRTRLRIAAASGSFVSPIDTIPQQVDGRWRTIWPRVETVAPQPDNLPWEQAAQLLARLHTEPAAPRTPAHGWPQRMRRTVDRTRDTDTAYGAVRRAAAALPAQAWRAGSPDRPCALVHGDWHLGQLGRRADGPWLLIDVDDLGVGDPAWDLARPAGFWAAGLIPDDDWQAFLSAYRGSAGPALPPGDPWPTLEPFARAAVVQAAASQPDDALLIAACARMG